MFSSGRGPLLLPFVAASMIRCSDRRVDYGSLHGATILIFNRDISIKVLKYMSEDLGQLNIRKGDSHKYPHKKKKVSKPFGAGFSEIIPFNNYTAREPELQYYDPL